MILCKGHFISEEEVDTNFKIWKQAGKPSSFGIRKSKIEKSQLARNHRRDCQNFDLLVKNNFDPTGLDVGTGLPSPWSTYGHGNLL